MMTPLLLSLALLVPAVGPKPTPPEGILPAGHDGRPLNLDFETGTLKDWKADGPAFQGQPVEGDTVHARRSDMHSLHQGRFWVGSYEKAGDKPIGTLTSVAFAVTHPWCSFLVGGGSHPETVIEIVNVKRNAIAFRASGLDQEDMQRVAVDLSKLVGQEIQVRLVDRHTGGWGHLNFDDFRFHATKPNVPQRASKGPPAKPDEYKFAGLKPEEAAAAMTVPEGFEVRLFAGEPDVHQPVGFCLDDRGRLWVAEAFTYPKRNPHPGPVIPDKKLGDRVLILEDTDGDGKHDKKTVFMEGLNLVSGIEVGFGGVWIGAAPYLLFIPDKNGDDKPDGDPQILLDGWGYQDTHETLNSFIWGPDGWLYGCHGVFTHSRVGQPGTPDEKRVPINAGVWRYHPTRHAFEVFAHGTSNPWGLDYNDVGDFFVEACVIPHCYHIVQGGRYQRQAGQHFNPYTYADIPTIADHRHYVGANPHGGNNVSDSMGGGHAHCGLMCYLGGAWPQEYRGQLFMGNIHGRRLNVDIPVPKGSGYVAKHSKDFLLANDAWARFINLRYGPDGNVYLIDWYDKQACHRNEPEIWDRTNGRVFKVVYKGTKPVAGIDLRKCSDEELVNYQLQENDWYVRHARRLLQERAVSREPKANAAITAGLTKIVAEHGDPLRRLRALWAIRATGGLNDTWSNVGLADQSEHVRAWTAQFLFESDSMSDPWLGRITDLASRDPSPVVRRAIASGLQRLPADKRTPIVRALTRHTDDAADHNLALLYWYAGEPLADVGAATALKVAADSAVPLLTYMARRVGAAGTPEAFAVLTESFATARSDDTRLALLHGLADGLKGRRGVAMPRGWPAAFEALAKSANADVRSQSLAVAVAFGDPKALDALRDTLHDTKADPAIRRSALTTLLDARDAKLPDVLRLVLVEPELRGVSIRALAAYPEDARTSGLLLTGYKDFSATEKRDALNTLASRVGYGKALLDAIASKKIPAADVPAEIIRQLRNLGDKALDQQIAAVWGTVRDTPADRKKLITEWSKKLTAKAPAPDLAHGRAVFAKTCQQCHTLYGIGGKVGPDITGANRSDLAYLMENVFDPSAVIPKEYAATKLDLVDGRVVTGIIKEETKAALTVLTANETLTIPAADVDKRTPSPLSMMPDDITKQLTEPELRVLFAYLKNPNQTPILATADNAKDFFNGKDLVGWSGDRNLWKVDNGEIVGTAPNGLKKNEFLKSPTEVTDFRLSLKVKLTPSGNSGVQFRSQVLPNGDVAGPQADIGIGWWGKLYEEHGRGLLAKEGGEKYVKPGEWNEYVVEAVGDVVTITINGTTCTDYRDTALARRGVLAFQLHSGGPQEVRFKDLKLEVLKK